MALKLLFIPLKVKVFLAGFSRGFVTMILKVRQFMNKCVHNHEKNRIRRTPFGGSDPVCF